MSNKKRHTLIVKNPWEMGEEMKKMQIQKYSTTTQGLYESYSNSFYDEDQI